MSRNRYEPALGVIALPWIEGEPDENEAPLPVLCEVWAPRLRLWDARKPEVGVEARLEVRVYVGDSWKALGYAGRLTEPAPGQVRRHARMARREWSATAALDGWNS